MARNTVGDFHTAGQSKCWFCGAYFPDAWIYTHVDKCTKNPANQEEDDE